MKKLCFILITVLLASASLSCSKTKDIAIVVTTDVHGTLFPGPDAEDAKTSSLARIPTLVSQLENEGYSVVLLDNGDILQGGPAVYYSNFVDTTNINILAQVLNYLNYSAITVGNHDIETGHSVYDKVRKELNFPMLSANAIALKSEKPYFEPYHIISVEGCKIAVMGLVTPWIPNWLPPVLYEGIEFRDMVESADKTMPAMLKENAAVNIGLFHSGWSDPTDTRTMTENGSSNVAAEVEGFDLIFIGHDHRNLIESVLTPSGDSIFVVDGGSHVRYASVAKIRMKRSFAGRWKIVGVKPEMVDMNLVADDKDYTDYFAGYIDEVNDYVNQKIGVLSGDVTTRDSWFGPSTLLSLIHKIQLETSLADVSFAAPLSFDASLPKGDILMSQLFSLYRYENFLYTMKLTGSEIDSYLEYSYSLWINTMTDMSSLMLNLIKGDDGKARLFNGRARFAKQYYNFDSAEGIEYTVDVTKPDGSRVNITGFSDGRHFSADSSYTVVLNSYRGNGGGGHITEGLGFTPEDIEARLLSSTTRDFRYYINSWIGNKGVVDADLSKNWHFRPTDWVREARLREMLLLYGVDE